MEQTFGAVAGNLAMTHEQYATPSRHPAPPPPQNLRALPLLPPAPARLEDLGLPVRFIHDVTLRTMYRGALPTLLGLAQAMHIPPPIVREIIEELKAQRLIETTSASGRLESEWHYRLTQLGMAEAEEAFARSRYSGPLPVPIQDYFAVLAAQGDTGGPDAVKLARALNRLVLHRDIVAKVCLALTSGRPALLWGAPGNGKTTILVICSEAMEGVTLLPIAVYVNGQIIRLYDELVHVPVADEETPSGAHDRRWLRIQRPFVFVGGELRHEDLDLAFDPAVGYHQAPPHVKAHGGLLVIDDFGRQQVSPQSLLNRWIAALERGEVTMSVVTGERITFPFHTHICFSTNLDPNAILEEAHLRRVPYKIRVPNPTHEQFAEIFRRAAAAAGVHTPEGSVEAAVELISRASGGNLRNCHPRDMINMVLEEARFARREPSLEPSAVRRACDLYFSNDPGPL